MNVTRRDVLRYGAATGLLATVRSPAADDFAKIVAAYRELQVGRNRVSANRTQAVRALDEVATAHNAAMNVGSDQLWPDLPTGPGSLYFPMMYYRLRAIAVDWATPGSALSAAADMPQRIVTALDTLYRVQYNENTAELGNWYVYEIGVPYWLLQIIVALGDRLPAADLQRHLRPIQRFVADPNQRTVTPGLVETGANRADKALITVVSGALLRDRARIDSGLAAVIDTAGDGAASLVKRVTTGDGYHTDGSFIQHGVVPYPGHYGLVLLTAVAGLIAVTRGTSSQLSAAVREAFLDTVSDVYAPFLTSGAMMEPVRGRMLSRQGETGHDAGHQLVAAVVLLAPYRRELAGLAARWIEEGIWAPYLKVTDVARFAGGLQMVGVPEVEYAEELLASRPRRPVIRPVHRAFPQSDRMVHATGRWSASLGCGSSRICRYEAINGQNLHGWYVGDGVLYTFLPWDQGHYSDAYWPTVDATLLPGTTTKDVPPPPLITDPPLTPNAWTGGVRWDERYGAYGLDFVSQDGTLTAKKSWFFTPDAVICLGAGIRDTSGAAVRTTIENRNLGAASAARLWRGSRRLHLEGVGGYVLLEDTQVTAVREDRTGSWYGIDTGANTHGTTTPYTRRYQKLVLDHGPNPSGATYAYAVLPGATPRQTASAAFSVQANTAELQALRLPTGTFAACFYAAGRLGRVSVSGPAAVMWHSTGRRVRIAITDPTQTQQTLRVTVAGVGTAEVNVGGSFGATQVVTL